MKDVKFIETTIPTMGRIRIKFYGIDTRLFDVYDTLKEFERQKQIKHLGIIAQINDGANHTRFDYLATQCAMVDMIENLNKGTQNVQLGSIRINGKTIEGNSLLKSWFLFSNLGHCFNTISDERSLLLYTFKSKGFRKHLINTIRDNDLKKWAKEVINSFNYRSYHYLLSLYRIYKCRYNQHNTKEIIQPIKILLLEDNDELVKNKSKLKQLKHIYKTIRMISIISLDSQYSHIPFSVNIFSSINSLSDWEEYYSEQHFIRHLDPFYYLLTNEIYSSERVLANQKKYEVEALKVIPNIIEEKDIDYLMELCFSKGLYNILNTLDEYKHFIRVPLFDNKKTFKEYLNDLSEKFIDMGKMNFIIELNTDTSVSFVDFVINNDIDGAEFAKCFNKICQFIQSQIDFLIDKNIDEFSEVMQKIENELELEEEQYIKYELITTEIIVSKVLKESSERLNPIYKALLWSTIKYFVKDNYTFDVVPTSEEYDSFGIRYDTINSLEKNLETAIEIEKSNEDRLNEIKQLYHSYKYKKGGLILACLSRVEVYDLLKSPNESKCTDIDGILVHSKPDSLIIELHESKNTKKPFKDAKKDINSKLLKILNNNKKGYRIKKVNKYGAKLYIKL